MNTYSQEQVLNCTWRVATRHRDLGWPNSIGFGSGLDSEAFRRIASGVRIQGQVYSPNSRIMQCSTANSWSSSWSGLVEHSQSVGMFKLPTSIYWHLITSPRLMLSFDPWEKAASPFGFFWSRSWNPKLVVFLKPVSSESEWVNSSSLPSRKAFAYNLVSFGGEHIYRKLSTGQGSTLQLIAHHSLLVNRERISWTKLQKLNLQFFSEKHCWKRWNIIHA